MTGRRPYRATATWQQAVDEIEHQAGTQFDPLAVQAFSRAEPALREIRTSLAA